MDERDRDREAGEDVRLLRGDPAEVLQPREPAVLDDEVELREVRGGAVDVGDVERVTVQRPDRRALVDVDVLDAEVLALRQVALGLVRVESPAARLVLPLGGVELDALEVVSLGELLELVDARLAVARIECPR
jgi:hypothetical protein